MTSRTFFIFYKKFKTSEYKVDSIHLYSNRYSHYGSDNYYNLKNIEVHSNYVKFQYTFIYRNKEYYKWKTVDTKYIKKIVYHKI